jgi:hypothetical protein
MIDVCALAKKVVDPEYICILGTSSYKVGMNRVFGWLVGDIIAAI